MRRGFGVMEMTVILLVLTPLTAAMVLQLNHGAHTDTISLKQTLSDTDPSDDLSVEKSETANTPPLLSSDMLLKSILMQSKMAEGRLRRRRAASTGCKFSTCQMQNLAITLYRMGQNNNKEQSKGAEDPNGYGR